MAEGVLFDIAEKVLNGLGALALQELNVARNAKAELTKLNDSISTIKAVLLDAEERYNNNHQVALWLRRLKDVVYDVDDLLDDLSVEALWRKTMKGNEISKEVRIFFSKSNQLAYPLNMGHRVKALREKLDVIAADRQQFHFSDGPEVSKTLIKERRQTHSFVRIEEVIGREDDKNAIIKLLLETNGEENIRVIPIVGIGGLGKTTLAQMVFNDEKVKTLFELKMWVCVSERFEVKLVAEQILEAATQKKPENCEMDTLQNQLRGKIDGKKYFLVLDDVWNEDVEKWSKLRDLLLGGANGSRIVVTTRSEKVGQITSTISSPPPYYILKGLSRSQSLSLFKQLAFEKQIQTSNAPDLDQLLKPFGEKITSLCAGVPLAIRAIGSVLRFKRTEEWKTELEKISQHGTDDITPILKLSYDRLPSYLKQCFAYCSLFPKDYRIEKHVLINLWMAQGFIQPLYNGQYLEDAGHDYFMDLLWRSFFQEVEEDELGNIESCKMHDLMHDLATSVAGTECSLTSLDVANVDEIHENTRHVSFGKEFNSPWKIPNALLKANKMRTFFQRFDYGELSESNSSAIIRSFRCLRMLNLKKSTFEKLSSSIRKLKHLRYLDLSQNYNIRELPNCMTGLLNLQTLDLSDCSKLAKWPREIRNMVSIRHLYIGGCESLKYMPRGLGQLPCLRTLTWFKVSRGDSRGGGLSELNGLKNLRGSLKILSLGNASTPEIGAAYLEEKSYLESLELEWSEDYEGGADDKMVLESLRPHPNLKKLVVENFKGAKFSNWLSSITNLVKIEINCCVNCRNLPHMDHLPSLKFLELYDLYALEHVLETAIKTGTSPAATMFFPSLEYLEIRQCPNLKGWWRNSKEDEDEDEESIEATSTIEEELLPCFPRLSTLNIFSCPKLTSFPPFPTINEQLNLFSTNGKVLRETVRMRSHGETTSSSITLHHPFSNLKSLELDSIENVESVLEEILQKTHCTSLQSLQITNCRELTLFPKEVHALPSLHRLDIRFCYNLRELPNWISNLDSLQELIIADCPELSSLPQGMSQLTNLRLLQIVGCPQLRERCRRDIGADWAQISHVPQIHV